MGVRILFGSLPSPPPVLSAEVLRRLRAPDGSRPCRIGLRKALRWIGDREIPIAQALEEARGVLSSSDLEWGRRALGISGHDYGYGYGYYGSGNRYGSGYGYGCGSGCYGYGSIYDDYGRGSGYSYGSNGSGHGFGDGDDEGYGYVSPGGGSGCGEEV